MTRRPATPRPRKLTSVDAAVASSAPRDPTRRQRLLKSLYSAVRNGHALPKSSGAKTFPGKQAVEHERSCQAMVVFKKKASLFERPFLARCEHIEHDVAGG